MVSPTSLRLVGASFTGLAAPNINNAESRFPCWPEEAYRTRGGEYKKKLSGEIWTDRPRMAQQRAKRANCRKREDMRQTNAVGAKPAHIPTWACSSFRDLYGP
jgi:hypothetical protein